MAGTGRGLTMRYYVNVPFRVEYLPDDLDTGEMYTIRQRCAGPVEAASPEEATVLAEQRIRAEYPFCWSLKIDTADITPLAAD